MAKAATTKKRKIITAKALKGKEEIVITTPKVKYKLLQEGEHEVRIYPPAKRTVINQGDGFIFLQFPYMILGIHPYQQGAFLYGCFALQDLSQLSEEDRMKATVYRMPFPKQFDRGMWGPCCLNWDSCYYQPGKTLDKLIDLFWLTEFRGVGDYGQKSIKCWSTLSLEEIGTMLEKSPKFYKGTYEQFLKATTRGESARPGVPASENPYY